MFVFVFRSISARHCKENMADMALGIHVAESSVKLHWILSLVVKYIAVLCFLARLQVSLLKKSKKKKACENIAKILFEKSSYLDFKFPYLWQQLSSFLEVFNTQPSTFLKSLLASVQTYCKLCLTVTSIRCDLVSCVN